MNRATVRPLAGSELTDRTEELTAIYAAVYREPPYNEDEHHAKEFASQIAEQSQRQGFLLIAAEVPDRSLVGFAYGITFPSDRWWRSAGAEPARTRGHQKFAIIEWVVLGPWRGQGIGQLLFSRLLANRPEPLATLCSNPSSDARTIYRSWGWEQVGTTSPPNMEPMDVLIKTLTPPEL
ncbi:GNAT family N-acetyltransferase [Dactylosporangium salmoneum]|uniref:GNAT family N-acetyltransferase n=1 Tax=Dactylosporangium salmoneum TaxID=53361 RepID=A0ABP5SX64_9ACTN